MVKLINDPILKQFYRHECDHVLLERLEGQFNLFRGWKKSQKEIRKVKLLFSTFSISHEEEFIGEYDHDVKILRIKLGHIPVDWVHTYLTYTYLTYIYGMDTQKYKEYFLVVKTSDKNKSSDKKKKF